MTEEFAVKKDQKLFVLYHSCSPIEANYKYNGIRILFSRLLKMVKTFDAKLTGTDEEIVTLLSKDIISEKDKAEFDARIKKVLNKMLIKKMRQIRITKDEELIESADIKVAKTALQGLLSKMNEIIKSMCEKEGATGFLTTIVLDNVHSFDLESLKIMASLTDNVKTLARFLNKYSKTSKSPISNKFTESNDYAIERFEKTLKQSGFTNNLYPENCEESLITSKLGKFT